MVDELLRVAGVAQQGATQANGNNEYTCAAELDSWIAAYEASNVSVGTPGDALDKPPGSPELG